MEKMTQICKIYFVFLKLKFPDFYDKSQLSSQEYRRIFLIFKKKIVFDM
jgi:hypothetical protein